ncbi:hypothetical protein [[Erwinia] mediterraneensis]|uniref:hypothetical protein n=1 Tax=[Erwinia] mediterraneensis TaxID=2161819 RepID=UPI0013EF438D|nr:hypothetical protein [[Erwinia] mediterraneensis]
MPEIKEQATSGIIHTLNISDSDKSADQPLNLERFGKTIAAVAQAGETLVAISFSATAKQPRSAPGKWWDWCRELFQWRNKSVEEEDPVSQESRRMGRRLYLEKERLLQIREAESFVRQPELRLKEWKGWLLGAGALIGIGSMAYIGGQWQSNRREKNDAPVSPYALEKSIHPDFDATRFLQHSFAARAEKLQQSSQPASASPSVQEASCDSAADLDACKDAYRFRKEADLGVSAKLTITTGNTRCVCPPEKTQDARTAVASGGTTYWRRGKPAESAPQLPLCEFEEDIKGCNDAYRFRKEAGLDPATSLTLSTGQRRCICPPEENDGAATSAKREETLIDLAMLSDYSKIEREPQAPKTLQNLIITKQLRRDFYNRHFYPLLIKASDKLKKKSIIITESTLMKEAINVISDMLGKLEKINLAHALRIDPLYNRLVLLVREIGRETDNEITLQANTQVINANRMIKKLNTIVTAAELDALQKECAELTQFYSDPENIYTEAYMSGRLQIIINHIILLFRQAITKLTAIDDGGYITDYLAAFFFNLDQDACQRKTPNRCIGKICTLYPELGISLFKYKQRKYRKVAAILLADTVFIPRLKEILNAAHITLENREFRLIDKVICAFAGSANLLYCENQTLFSMAPENSNNTGGAVQNSAAPEEALDNYLSLPVPFYGAAAGASGLGFVVGAGIMGHPVGAIQEPEARVTNSHPGSGAVANPLANTEAAAIDEVTGSSNANAQSSVSDGPPGGDLVRFPEIPVPPPGETDELLLLNPVARREFKGKDFIIVRGLTSDVSGEVPEYIRQAQAILRTHVDHTSEMINNLWRTLRMRASDEDYMAYLRRYFRGALNTDNEQIIDMAITRFKEIVERARGFFNRSLRQKYSNIFIVSTRQAPTSFAGEYNSLLSEEELKGVPNAISFFSTEPSIAIFTDSSYLLNPEHDLSYRRTLTHDLGDTLRHEATHFAGTRDYFYLPRTATGRSTNARDAYRNIRLALENMDTEADLQAAILSFIRERNLPYPDNIMDFLEAYPVFGSYILMNSAEHLEIFIRDIASGLDFDSPAPW